MTSRNKREGKYTGSSRENKRTGTKGVLMSYKRFNFEFFNRMAYVHWIDGIIGFYPLWVVMKKDYVDE